MSSVDEEHEFERLKHSMEMVGFKSDLQKRIFAVISAILLLGNIEFVKVCVQLPYCHGLDLCCWCSSATLV